MILSVFIPTIPSHLIFLDKILDCYVNKSTVKPDEIVVSISNFSKVDPNIYTPLKEKYKSVIFLEHDEIKLAGPNRQCSKDSCSGDIIMYQDSDDLPHIQRVEIVKYFFENYDIVQLNHSLINLTKSIIELSDNDMDTYNEDYIDIKNIKTVDSPTLYKTFFPNGILEESVRNTNAYCYPNGYKYDFQVHSGAVSIRKEVLDTIKWKNRNELYFSPMWNYPSYKGAEDYEFCMETLHKHNKSIIIDAKVYFYLG